MVGVMGVGGRTEEGKTGLSCGLLGEKDSTCTMHPIPECWDFAGMDVRVIRTPFPRRCRYLQSAFTCTRDQI